MRKQLRAAGLPARLRHSCVGAITGSLVVLGLSACGGGGDGSPDLDSRPSGFSDVTTKAQATPISLPATLIKDSGWATPAPTLPPRTFPTPQTTIKTHYIDYTSQTDPPGFVRNGATPATAWRNLDDFNSNAVLTKNGDVILFRCGTVHRGNLKSLQDFKNLYIGTYVGQQSGPSDCADNELPIIRASRWGGELTWSVASPGSPIMRASVSGIPQIPRLFSGTKPLPEARYPNATATEKYLPAAALTRMPGESNEAFTSRSRNEFKLDDSTRQIIGTDSSKIVGATVYIRSTGYSLERKSITNYDASTGIATLLSSLKHPATDGVGYYLSGKSWMLDEAGEWYRADDHLYYYPSGSKPVSSLEFNSEVYSIGIKIQGGENVTISRLRLEHQEYIGIAIESSKNVNISGVEILFPQQMGIAVGRWGTKPPSEGVTVQFSKVRGAGAYGIKGGQGGASPTTKNVLLTNNVVLETGMHGFGTLPELESLNINGLAAIRLGGPTPATSEANPPTASSLDAQAIGNILLNNGGPGIVLANGRHGAVIDSNTVINSCLLHTDCGGIYATNHNNYKSHPEPEGSTSARISNNIVIGTKGDLEGLRTSSLSSDLAREHVHGIYLDDLAANIEVFNNQISHAGSGIYLHNAAWNKIHHNTIHAVRLASIRTHSDWTYLVASGQPRVAPVGEVMRGNEIYENTLVSHRTVDPTALSGSNDLQRGIQVTAPQVYAQLWIHESNPSAFFTGTRPNVSKNNRTLTHSPAGPTTWRMGRNEHGQPQAKQASGGIWGFITTNGTRQEVALPAWRSRVQTSSSTHDTEESLAVSYRPYVLTLGNDGNSLVQSLLPGSNWIWNAASQVPYANGTNTCGGALVCAGVQASQNWHTLQSPAFQTTPGTIYAVKYTVKQGPVRGEHNTSVRRSNDFAQVGEYVQSVYTEPDETRRYEHFFRANSNSGANTVLHVKPSDGVVNSPKPYTTQYFSEVTVHPVSSWEVLPPLDQLTFSVANPTSSARTFTCAELGISSNDCNLLRDDSNQLVGSNVTVDGRTIKRFYIASPQWAH